MIRNANEFLIELRNARFRYTERYAPRIAEIRRKYADLPGGRVPGLLQEALEIHERTYYVNALLQALNWRLDSSVEDGLPGLLPEVPVRSATKGTIRFLDYLGIERQDDKPLLIVETKRPSEALPRLRMPRPGDELKSSAEVLCDGLQGTRLLGDWNEWLDTLRDYVQSLYARSGYYPSRVVMTNGEWLIIFADIGATILSATPDAAGVAVLSDFRAWERLSREIFQTLNYHAVASASPSLQIAELPFRVRSSDVEAIMHGLRLLFAERPTLKYPGVAPQVEVRPIAFIQTRSGAWLRVESESSFELPFRYGDLPVHLNEVRQAAIALLDEIRGALGTNLNPKPLRAHYSSDSFLTLAGVAEERFRRDVQSSEYLIVTGEMTHYLLPEPAVSDCPFHRWAANGRPGNGPRMDPIFTRRVRVPRSFFVDGELHHCAHFVVAAAKSSPITEENRSRCGPRSGSNGEAFCEIAPFEQYLCCRACAFAGICIGTEVLHLPCQTSGS